MRKLELQASDGHVLSAWLAEPAGTPRGAVVVVQEIFGVNPHVRRVAEQYAAGGYLAIAPAMFDRYERDLSLGYDAEGLQRGVAHMMKTTSEATLADLGAAIDAVRSAGRVGMVGYCWGGRATYLAACRTDIAAGVVYYGGRIPQLLPETPRCPVMFHFGERDGHIPLDDVEQVRAAYPSGIYHLYPAGHGFNCEERADFDAGSARLAFDRTIEFFRKHVGQEAP